MYARFGLMVLVLLFVVCFPVETIANDGTFGLGVSSGNNFAPMSMFGLDTDCVQAKTETKERVVLAPPLVASNSIESVSDSRVSVVRRARSSWVDSSVGAWNVEKLRSHLRGELASPQHRGNVPTAELEGRTLRELADIHDNLHEGYAWNGSSSVVHSRSVAAQSFQTTAKMASSCPGGVCPSPISRPARRLFRR